MSYIINRIFTNCLYLCIKQFIKSTIVIKPRNREEEAFLTKMLRKMNVDAHLVHEPFPNYDTIVAIQDVESGKGTKAKDSKDLFD